MNYEKLGFVSGQKLKAEHMNHIENGISQLSEDITNLPKSDIEEIEMLIEIDLLPAVTTTSGAILTDNNRNLILRY